MVSAWYMSEFDGDDRDEHRREPNEPVTVEELYEKTGVEYVKMPLNGDYTEAPEMKKIKAEKAILYQDHVDIARDRYGQRRRRFVTEHMHPDEEIRMCVKGSAYFDVRDSNDEWIRVHLVPGDMIILPAGIYHSFTPDHGNYVKLFRLFAGEPVWTPVHRPAADRHPVRQEYCKRYQVTSPENRV